MAGDAKLTKACEAVALIEAKIRKTICNTYSSGGGLSIEGRITKDDFEVLLSFAQIGVDATATIENLRGELFSLCEQTEENSRIAYENHPNSKQGEFSRGRMYEAKGIRRTMGEIFAMSLTASGRAALTESGKK